MTFLYAQEEIEMPELSTIQPGSTNPADMDQIIIQSMLTVVIAGASIAGTTSIAIMNARQQGLRISAEAEEYFINSIKSFVEGAYRGIYRQMKNDSQYAELFTKGIVPDELENKATDEIIRALKVELISEEFTKVVKYKLEMNLEPLVNIAKIKYFRDSRERLRKLLFDIVPSVVDAELLPYKNSDDPRKDIQKIIHDCINRMRRILHEEEIFSSDFLLESVVRSELKKRFWELR